MKTGMFLLIIRSSWLNLESFTAIKSSMFFICFSHFHLFKNQSYTEHPLGTQLSNTK